MKTTALFLYVACADQFCCLYVLNQGRDMFCFVVQNQKMAGTVTLINFVQPWLTNKFEPRYASSIFSWQSEWCDSSLAQGTSRLQNLCNLKFPECSLGILDNNDYIEAYEHRNWNGDKYLSSLPHYRFLHQLNIMCTNV